jgi:hypothetical protein
MMIMWELPRDEVRVNQNIAPLMSVIIFILRQIWCNGHHNKNEFDGRWKHTRKSIKVCRFLDRNSEENRPSEDLDWERSMKLVSSIVRQMPGYNSQDGARPALPNFSLSVLFSISVLCVLFVCKCVMYCCHLVPTQLRLNISYIISYHIISYHIISYHIINKICL